jgi:hypothetical protein
MIAEFQVPDWFSVPGKVIYLKLDLMDGLVCSNSSDHSIKNKVVKR